MTHAPSPDITNAHAEARTGPHMSIPPAPAAAGEPRHASHTDADAQSARGSARAGASAPDHQAATTLAQSQSQPQPAPGKATSTGTRRAKTPQAKTRSRTPAKRRRAHPRWRDVFLEELAQTSNVAAAARVAGVDVSTVYRARRTEGEFLRRWHDALAEGYDNLEMELVRRLRSGELDGGGKGTGGTAKRKFDNAIAARLLAAHRENVTRQRGRRAFEDEDAVIASINARLETIRQRLIAAGTPGLDGE